MPESTVPAFPLARSLEDRGQRVFAPAHYHEAEREALLRIIKHYPLAQLITSRNDRVRVTAVPLLNVPGAGSDEPLRLIGHLARRNPHSDVIAGGGEATAVFTGPSAYVSPRWFRVKHTAATWNYQVLQVHGRLEPVTSAEGMYRILEDSIARFEDTAHAAGEVERWHMGEMDSALRERLLPNITAFTLHVETVEAVNRLAQDKHLQDQLGIMAGLGQSPQPGAGAVLAAMAELIDSALPTDTP